MSQITLKGSCLCKGVQYSITGIDKGAVLCHCSNCRKSGGSAFMHNTRVMKATIEHHKGSELIKTFDDGDTKTGTHLYRTFCSNCGSSLYLQSASVPGLIVAQCSALDDHEPRKPKFELFEEDRVAWMSKVATPKM